MQVTILQRMDARASTANYSVFRQTDVEKEIGGAEGTLHHMMEKPLRQGLKMRRFRFGLKGVVVN
jgi:hypothetical protein